MLKLTLLDQRGNEVVSHSHDQEVFLGIKNRAYEAGDRLQIEWDEGPGFLWVQMDEALSPALIYLNSPTWSFDTITSESLRRAYSSKVFSGERHYVRAWKPRVDELHYRNLALNSHDQKKATGAYPHAFANVETREDATFFARNAIDGMIANNNHGSFPFQSWGINQQKDAMLTIDFGREVLIDSISLVLRADYPHDSYWTKVTLDFENGTSLQLDTTNRPDHQFFQFEKQVVTKVTLRDLVKHQDDSPFPALTEIEVYGNDM